MRRPSHLRSLLLCAFTAAAVTAAVALPSSARAAVLPPNDPPDSQPSAGINAYCYPPVNAAACDQASLAAINGARAIEGVGPMILPTNYYSLPAPDQLLVVVDLERADRGLPAIAGLTPGLNSYAEQGAATNSDPPLPPAPAAASAWLGGWGTPLYDDFIWMYDDGPGGPNINCCWGHRNEILASWPGPLDQVEMGAAVASTSYYSASAALVIAAGQGDPPSFSWAGEYPYLTFNTIPGSIDLGASPGHSAAETGLLQTSGAGGRFAFSIQGGGGHFFVYPTSCVAPPGAACAYRVNYTASGNTPVTASLNIAGPTRTRSVLLRGGPWDGNWLIGSDGGVHGVGTAQYFGSTSGIQLSRPVVGAAGTPDHLGYLAVASDGGVFNFGDAHFYGSTGGVHLVRPVVGVTIDRPTGGYWMVASDGGVFSFNAPFRGSTGGVRLAAPVVGMAANPNGQGYWLVGSDGGVFSFGSSRFLGSVAGETSAPVVGIASTPDGGGYWMAAADGSVYAFGDARFRGSLYGNALSAPIVGIAPAVNGSGYRLAGADGAVYSFGAAFDGSAYGASAAPIVAMAG